MRALGIFLAVSFHLAVILFGGMFLLNDKEKAARVEERQEMEIEEEKPPEEKPDEKPKEEEKMDAPAEAPKFDAPLVDAPPAVALAPLSLSDLEGLLGGTGGDSAFGGGGGLSAGGVLGGAGGGGDGSGVLSSARLDQRPRLVTRVDPKPPSALARTLPEVTVTVFIDAAGNVMKADVTPEVAPAAMKPITDAVLRWKYEPGMRNGQKVGCKVSHKIHFQG